MINQLKEELQKLKEEEFDGARAKALWDEYLLGSERLILEYEKDAFDLEALCFMHNAYKQVYEERAEKMNQEISDNTTELDDSEFTKEQVLSQISNIKEGLQLTKVMAQIATSFRFMHKERSKSLIDHINALQEESERRGISVDDLIHERFESLSDEAKEKKLKDIDELDDDIFYKYGCRKKDAVLLQEIVGRIPEFEGLI